MVKENLKAKPPKRKLHIVNYDPSRAGPTYNYQIGLCGRDTRSWEKIEYMKRVDKASYNTNYCKQCKEKYEYILLLQHRGER